MVPFVSSFKLLCKLIWDDFAFIFGIIVFSFVIQILELSSEAARSYNFSFNVDLKLLKIKGLKKKTVLKIVVEIIGQIIIHFLIVSS
jgi:hypothetical protein